jgi:hypothetical protein
VVVLEMFVLGMVVLGLVVLGLVQVPPNFRLFAAIGNGKRKFVFFSRQTINGN